ncbi:MAG TPA: RDD family protein [Thermoanaerobaculia bacterium]|nr:RDD family protein [Thermoanaerobaculia bacterium]
MSDLQRESILGLDNIRLDLPVAGVGSRVLAALLDYLVMACLAVAWFFVWAMLFARQGPWTFALLFIVFFLLEWGYFAGQEIGLGGRTLGKMALKLRVLTAKGGTPGAGALLARNLVRSLDIFFGIPLLALDPLSRRLGDRLAGTIVVHDREREAVPILGRVPPGWGARELALVEALLARAQVLDDPALVWQMADRVLERIRHDAPEMLAGVDTRRDPVAALRQALQVEEG